MALSKDVVGKEDVAKEKDKDRSAEAVKESPFDLKDTHPERKIKPDPEQAALLKELERGLKDSFPASDPVSVSQPTTAGPTEDVDLPKDEDGNLLKKRRKVHRNVP